MKSTKLLMEDHEIILLALHVLDEMITEAEHGKEFDQNDIRALLAFFREFADGCHHVKEEAIFFPALVQAGMTFHDGPLRVISYEHERGRAITSAMSESIEQNRKGDFLRYAQQYVRLLTEHITKENHVLFDIAEKTLAAEEDDKIADDFEQFEKNIAGVRTHEHVQTLIENLASKYLRAVA